MIAILKEMHPSVGDTLKHLSIGFFIIIVRNTVHEPVFLASGQEYLSFQRIQRLVKETTYLLLMTCYGSGLAFAFSRSASSRAVKASEADSPAKLSAMTLPMISGASNATFIATIAPPLQPIISTPV